MTTNNVKVTTNLLFPSKGSNKTDLKRSTNDFSSIMDTSVKASSNDKDKPSHHKLTEKSNAPNQSDKVNTSSSDRTKTKATVVDKDSLSIKQDSKAKSLDGLKKETTLEETVLSKEQLEEMAKSIQNMVKNTFDITEEELEKVLETIGLTVLDLLNNENLKQFVLQMNGTSDITEALTNENLINSINNMLKTMDDFKKTEGFHITEDELKKHLDTLNGNIEEVEQVNVNVNKYNKTDVKHEERNIDVNPQKDITVEVHRVFSDTEKFASSDDSSKNKQNNDVSLQSPVNVFINNLAVNNDSLGFAEQIAYQRQLSDITNQIVEQIKIIIKPDQTSMELNLNPDYLGKVNLSVVSKDGVLTARFTTQTEVAKEVIESQIQILKDNLNNQGLKVDAIEVTVSNFEFAGSNQTSSGENKQNNSNNRRVFKDDEAINSITESDEISNETISQGSSIDYTA